MKDAPTTATVVTSHSEKPFSWESLSEVEDEEESAVPTMTEPEVVQLSPQQFFTPTTEVFTTERSPSLQEAFRQHKANFISNSKSRVRQLKEKSKQRMTTPTNHIPPPPHDNSKKCVTTPKASSRVVQFSSPLTTLQDTGVFSPPTIHRANSECLLYHLIFEGKIFMES